MKNPIMQFTMTFCGWRRRLAENSNSSASHAEEGSGKQPKRALN